MLIQNDAQVDDGLPADVRTAQRRVARAISVLAPPAAFSVLVEAMAQEIVASGVAASPFYEEFIKMQVGALLQRVRGVCAEMGVEIEEETEASVPAPVARSWWRRLVPASH